MALKTFKPITPGLRQLVIVDRSELHKGKPVKSLTEGKSQKGGRNNTGRITVRFRGGGHKQTYRIIDFKRRKMDMPAKVERIEYDPNRTAFIALIRYADNELAYIIAPQRLGVGPALRDAALVVRELGAQNRRLQRRKAVVAAGEVVNVLGRRAGDAHLRHEVCERGVVGDSDSVRLSG